MVLDNDHKTIEASTKEDFYIELAEKTDALLSGKNLITNLSLLSALVYHELLNTPHRKGSPVNWAGFYYLPKSSLLDSSISPNEYVLELGPFQGKVACTLIKFGRGVCGSVAVSKKPIIVPNVNLFEGHIACDSTSLSELVIPIVIGDQLVGVFDLDCSVANGFDNTDLVGIERLVSILVKNSDWFL
ncbi:Free methionine-R-sulfoxide reductase [Smittium mucronatum]|uniref:Free methionine-R-sulfoxide reductase n=1 Tax=Smittium mucronatum TaxID=133383 RepID=A0A1R0H852_9FUNG|nr:Free methionine-R-sulfoxide reductase [Smittium mucronatum]